MGLFFSATATFILVLSLILEQSVITCEAKALYNDNNYDTEPDISTSEDYDNFNVTDEMETTDPHVSMPDAMKDFMSMIEHTEEEPDISIPEDASGCSRVSYSVNFQSLQDFNFVLLPQSVDIGQCSGNCAVPGHNISPYYKMMLYHGNFPEPCCVPVAFAPATVLLQVQNRIRLTIIEDLIVKTCGCR